MTGFTRVDGARDGRSWIWEIKTVNARGLELRFRLPTGFDDLELDLRKAAQKKLSRGALSATLSLHADAGAARHRVNEAALAEAIAEVEKIRARLKCDPPRAEGLLALRGVIEPFETAGTDDDREALAADIAASFEDGVNALVAAREAEGANVARALGALFDESARLTQETRKRAASATAELRARIAAQIDELLAGSPIPEDRLAQEAALLAVKADIREELDRLAAHIEAGRGLLIAGGPAGRQLDFLSQELNREANTICAKAHNMEIKRIGLELKKVIDQLREQVQNIE